MRASARGGYRPSGVDVAMLMACRCLSLSRVIPDYRVVAGAVGFSMLTPLFAMMHSSMALWATIGVRLGRRSGRTSSAASGLRSQRVASRARVTLLGFKSYRFQ